MGEGGVSKTRGRLDSTSPVGWLLSYEKSVVVAAAGIGIGSLFQVWERRLFVVPLFRTRVFQNSICKLSPRE